MNHLQPMHSQVRGLAREIRKPVIQQGCGSQTFILRDASQVFSSFLCITRYFSFALILPTSIEMPVWLCPPGMKRIPLETVLVEHVVHAGVGVFQESVHVKFYWDNQDNLGFWRIP